MNCNRIRRVLAPGCLVVAAYSAPAVAASLDLAVGGTGLSLGDSRGIRGVRINLVDRRLERVVGVNVTLLSAWGPRRGEVVGVAVGLKPGLRRVHGLGLGILALDAKRVEGVVLATTGAAAGGDVRGLLLGGIGASVGDDATGVLVGGIGSAVGGTLKGISIGGVGTSVQGDLTGLSAALIGASVGGDFKGVGLAGIGMYAAGDARGLVVSGIGAAVGGHFRGIVAGAWGVSVAGDLEGIAIGGVEVTATRVSGLTVGLLNGVSLNSLDFRAVNDSHHGVAMGVFNFSRELTGVQIGLLNYAGNNPKWARLLPIINVHR
jgi:hypothetical protein